MIRRSRGVPAPCAIMPRASATFTMRSVTIIEWIAFKQRFSRLSWGGSMDGTRLAHIARQITVSCLEVRPLDYQHVFQTLSVCGTVTLSKLLNATGCGAFWMKPAFKPEFTTLYLSICKKRIIISDTGPGICP